MATLLCSTSFFVVFQRFLAVVFVLFWRETFGDSVHLMSVTPTPSGASQSGTSFVCLLSDPDTDQLNNVIGFRFTQRGNVPPYNTHNLPSGVTPKVNPDLSKVTFDLPASIEAQGTFSCQLTNRGFSTGVPVTILANSRRIQPANGQFTVTASVGERVVLETEIQQTPDGKLVSTDTRWERQGQNDFGIVQEGGTTYEIASVLPQDADVYATYWSDQREDFLFSLIRLIVRDCPSNTWNPPYCNQVCNKCYNGGICDDETGDCVCRPGFSGPNCLTACSIGRFGWDCKHQCGVTVTGSSCVGVVLCMPDPMGCSCITGLAGSGCQQSCPSGTFGAGCTDQCHCLNGGSCNTVTGVCDSGSCADGWSGTNCQIPEQCSIGYYGDMCLSKCNCRCDQTTGSCAGTDECVQGVYGTQCQLPCYCLNGAACERETGQCDPDLTTGLSLCLPGFGSSTEADFDNCGQYDGCFDSCSKTYHCNGGSTDCNGISGACSEGCKTGWFGDACQTRIFDLTFEKVNDGQNIPVTVLVSVEPSDTLITTELWLQYNDIQSGPQIRYPDMLESREGFYFATFSVDPPDGNTMSCYLLYTSNGQGGVATSTFVAEYYALPVIGNRQPMATTVSNTSVTLQWDAWGTQPGDTGDGPVTLYNIYKLQPQVELIGTVSDNQQQSVITTVIGDLMPGTTYIVYVTAVRDGVGGEGDPSQFATFTTLSVTTITQPVPTTKAATTQPTTTPTPDATITKSPTTTKVTPTKRMTTMEAVDTDPPVVDMTTLVRMSSKLATPTVPNAPVNFATLSTEATRVTIGWSDPEGYNWDIILYHIDYRPISRVGIASQDLTKEFTNETLDVRGINDKYHEIVLRDLMPDSVYEVFVSAESVAGIGNAGRYAFGTKSVEEGNSPSSSSGFNTGVVVGSSIAVILLLAVIIIIVVIFVRKRSSSRSSSEHGRPYDNADTSGDAHFQNPSFHVDDYEDIGDQEYAYVKESKWDVPWEDLNLTGQILGKGNFGKVQLGEVRIRDKWIKAAVKTLKEGTPESEKALFKDEFGMMTRIGHHVNVVNTLGSCERAGCMYVILEYIPHGNLRKFLRKSRMEISPGGGKPGRMVSNLNPDQLLKFAVGVAEGMKHISAKGVIHRDLAARNILVGNGLTPKVADFGMSREQNEYVQSSSQRVPTRWLSIESLTEKMYSTKSDVWSFGILLWEIATLGGTPYSDMETKHLAYRLSGGYRMPKPDNCEQEMYDLMLMCWQANPGDRPTFQEILDILVHMTSQEKIYMSTRFYQNFQYAAIRIEKDDG